MAPHEHKLFTTPVSMNDGFKRSDSKTWLILGVVALVALALVVALNVFVEKPKIRWPDSQPQGAAPAKNEPRTFDVAPPNSVPPPPGR